MPHGLRQDEPALINLELKGLAKQLPVKYYVR